MWVLRALLAVPVLAVLSASLLWLRLCWAPIQLGWLAHRLAPATLEGDALGFDRVWLQRDRSGAIVMGASALSLRRPGGTADFTADRLDLSLRSAALLSGVVEIDQLSLRGAGLVLVRDPDGSVRLPGAPKPPPDAGGGGHGGPVRLDRLRAVRLDAVSVLLLDQQTHRRFGLKVERAVLRPWHGLAEGEVQAAVSVDGRDVPLRGSGVAGGAGLDWHLQLGAIQPSRFVDLLPALSAIALPVTPEAELVFAPGVLRPQTSTVRLSLGAGALAVAKGTLPVRSGEVVLSVKPEGATGLSATLQPSRLALGDPAGVDVDAPVFTADGSLSLDDVRTPRRIRAALSLDSARVGFPGLARFWPDGVAEGARRWITGNITAGVATGLHVRTTLSGDQGWSSLRETRREGGFDAHDLEMWWLRPMPPLERMRAHIVFQGPDALLVQSPDAMLPVEAVGPEAMRLAGDAPLSPLLVSDGSMRITGLGAREQIGTVHLVLSGGVRELMSELATPRLSLLSKHPVPFTAPSGTVRSEVTVQLPLEAAVAIENVSVSSHSVLRGAHLGDVAGGMALDDADLSVSADTNGLVLDGVGAIGSIDSRLHYAMDFRAGPPDQLLEQATVEGTVGTAALSGLGLNPGTTLSGTGGLTLQYAARRDGRSTVRLALDMTGLAIALPVWSKRAGQTGSADAVISLDHGHLVSVGPIHADGPSLSIEGEVSTPAHGPRLLQVGRFLIGRTRGAGEVVFPRAGGGSGGSGGTSAPIRIDAHGPSLDLAAIIDAGHSATPPATPPATPLATGPATGPAKSAATGPHRGPAGASKAAAGKTVSGPSWIADLRFDRVFVGRKTTLGQVAAHLENNGRALVAARVEAQDPTSITVRLHTEGDTRVLDGTASDTGRLLSALGVTDAISGGAMHLGARLPLPADATGVQARVAPMTGTVQIDHFLLPDAPFAARLVRDLSIYGWLLALNTPQLSVDRLVAPFSLRDEVLTLSDARAHAAALGVTMRGTVDLGRQRLDLHGTVVPAWALNQLPGRLPLVGRLLAPEKGGGVLALTLGIKGPFADPRISVDPLSALAPGFLRRLLFD